MNKELNSVRNKWRHYMNRIFLSDTNNNVVWYKQLVLYLLGLDNIFNKKLKVEYPSIVLISDNLLTKIIVFTYTFITNTDLILISPKFTIAYIVNAILFNKKANVLILDKNIENMILQFEKEENIIVLNYFKYVETTMSLIEKMNSIITNENEVHLNRLYKKGINKTLTDSNHIAKVSIFTPGTSSEPSVVNVPYQVLFKSMKVMSHFMGLKTGDKISVITDFEFFPNIFTLLGLLNGLFFIQPAEDIQSSNDFIDQFKTSYHKPSIIVISSDKFKTIWDGILLKVYGNKILFKLSKIQLLSWIPIFFILKEIKKVFGKNVNKIHILNEELGTWCLDVLRKSKISFTSSYGFIEQGNFLAFKDPILFKHRNFYSKSGGTLLKDSEDIFESVHINENPTISNSVGEITVETNVKNKRMVLLSEDLGTLVDNVQSQGNRKYLHVLSRKNRHLIYSSLTMKLDFIEKSIKDNILIRDCFLIRVENGYRLYIEPREDLLDTHNIKWDELNLAINLLIKETKDIQTIDIVGYAILNFKGFRNIAGKLQYYLL